MLYHYWYRLFFFFSSRRRHTRWPRDWSSDVCSSDLEGYAWLSLLYDHRLGGVLADDMGLGKTLQTLALIVRARSLEPDAPPFLVVAPASVLPRSEEHTSELQSRGHLVCRLLLEKKKNRQL